MSHRTAKRTTNSERESARPKKLRERSRSLTERRHLTTAAASKITAADLNFARGLDLRGDEIGYEWDKFRDYYVSKGERRADWGAAWRNWVRRHVERKRQDAADEWGKRGAII